MKEENKNILKRLLKYVPKADLSNDSVWLLDQEQVEDLNSDINTALEQEAQHHQKDIEKIEEAYKKGFRDGMNNRERTSQKILDIVSSYQSAKGYPPTLKEIADTYGAKSITTIQRALKNLKKMGLVSQNKYQKRAWYVKSIPRTAKSDVLNTLKKGK